MFVIVSDHGETQMPTDLKYRDTNWLGMKVDRDAEMSCVLKTEFGDADNPDVSAQKAERENNSLHIWELGEMFKAIGKAGNAKYVILAPQAISKIFTVESSSTLVPESAAGATADIKQANVIAALNGPMAHIYLRGPEGWSDEHPDIVQLSKLAQDIKNNLMDGGIYIKREATKKMFKNLLSSIDRILIRVDGVYKNFKGVQLDTADNVIGSDTDTITETYFDANAYTSAFGRIEEMNHPKRSGDIVLIMRDSTTGSARDRFSTAYACKSWHGSLNRSDSYVPFIVAYPGGNKQVVQLFIDATSGCSSTTGCDGNWKTADLINAIIQMQFGTQ